MFTDTKELLLNATCISYIATIVGLVSLFNTFTGNSAPLPVAASTDNTQVISEQATASVEQNRKKTAELVRKYLAGTPDLIAVAYCESGMNQFAPDGEVLRGDVVTEDVGLLQINEKYHLKTAEKLGFDIYTLEGNIEYGKYLYDKQGLQPWSASKKCWQSRIQDEYLAKK